MVKKKGAQTNRETVGLMLRIEVPTLRLYEKVMTRAKMMDLKRGGNGQVTVQDVMRHQLKKLESRLSRRRIAVCCSGKAEDNE